MVLIFIPMIDPKTKQTIQMRCQLVLNNLRHCNSGSEIHIVGNLRNVAQGILEILDQVEDDVEMVTRMLENTEKQQVEFFKKKFGYYR